MIEERPGLRRLCEIPDGETLRMIDGLLGVRKLTGERNRRSYCIGRVRGYAIDDRDCAASG